ncbi:MAG: asparagine synthetase B family protein [Planctomycetes bacterium]|nr:asparagine synthetase B family protein [Planctomycetota bacterium]MCH9724505.1 asparagine synthetase B family protein [Planctomycetota bacterium]MCH9777984.1 asparagine synthetase B family protein [Planctomycetota bacterium]MCH9791756.1 asparagine synthetase B family protein [Planctomycetota bacterium]MDF1746417.1 asparagine synthase-related protein [Gimesia sp.]
MVHDQYVERLVNLLDSQANLLFNMTFEEATERVGSGSPERVREIAGQFAIVHKDGTLIRMARSIGRPMRFFLAKRAEGPCLVIAERIDEIYAYLKNEGLDDQFHPSYTRMVPAHHILELQLIGCPDPNPKTTRFLNPNRNCLSNQLDEIGNEYISAVYKEINKWLDAIPPQEPLGVLFSGGVDSGALFILLYHALITRNESPSRMKAFTLSIDGEGTDCQQALQFLEQMNLSFFLEVLEVPQSSLHYEETIKVVEDYKQLDVQAATMTYALCRKIRELYPRWKYLIDGDGGDENLKDYPIEANPELTIRSVLNNTMLYQEGWGVNAVKHSLTYSGGQSRGHVRTYAPARSLGFQGFSPYALPNVIEIAEGIPYIELTDWNHKKLYALKGDIVCRGIKQITGISMPVYPKRRFQEGSLNNDSFQSVFAEPESVYRQALLSLYE